MIVLRTSSLGGGVQSSTIAEMVVEGELPRPDVFIFVDTGDEPDYVYRQIEYLRGRLAMVDMPLVTVTAGNMVEDIYNNGRFAAMPLFTKQLIPISGFGVEAHNEQIGRLHRHCTFDYKVEPIEKWIRENLLGRGLARRNKSGAILVNKGITVETWLGISLDEVERMKPSRTKWIVNRWPLIDQRMTRQKCIEWLTAHSLPIPKKSACKRCPYHDTAYWRDMRDNRPGDWQEVTGFDNDLRNGRLRLAATSKGALFFTEECIPLTEIDLSTPQERGQSEICDEGYCMI